MFPCRWRKVDTEEPPGAETTGAVGLHGSFQNKQRSPGGYQLARTVRSPPFSLAHLPSCPFPLRSVLSAFSSDYASHVAQPPAALRRLLWQQSPVKAWTGPVLFSPTPINIHITTESVRAFSHCEGLAAALLPVKHTNTCAYSTCG